MPKKIPIDLQEIYDVATKKIDVILLNQNTINLLRNDENFQSLFANIVSIVNVIATKYDLSTNNIAHYTQAYHQICNKTLKFDDKQQTLSNIIDIKDTINYLDVYLSNTIGLSFDEIENELKNVAKNKSNNETDVEKDDNPTPPIITPLPSSNAAMSDEELLRRSGVTMHDVADQLVASQASMYLQQNIRRGSVYIYDSKPKIIPIVKYIAFALFIVVLCLLFASYGVLLSQNEKVKINVTTNNQQQEIPCVFVSPIPVQQILLLFIIGIICWSIIRNIKNDNAKYFVSWGWMLFYTIFLIITSLAAQETRVLLFNYNTLINKLNEINSNKDYLPTLESFINIWKCLQYTCYAIYGGLIICVILGCVFNPKRDGTRISKLLEEYTNEIRNGTIDTSGLNSGFGGFGSQLF